MDPSCWASCSRIMRSVLQRAGAVRRCARRGVWKIEGHAALVAAASAHARSGSSVGSSLRAAAFTSSALAMAWRWAPVDAARAIRSLCRGAAGVTTLLQQRASMLRTRQCLSTRVGRMRAPSTAAGAQGAGVGLKSARPNSCHMRCAVSVNCTALTGYRRTTIANAVLKVP